MKMFCKDVLGMHGGVSDADICGCYGYLIFGV